MKCIIDKTTNEFLGILEGNFISSSIFVIETENIPESDENSKIIFKNGELVKVSKKEWIEFQISLNNISIEKDYKVNSEGEIVKKTFEDYAQELTLEELKEIKRKEILEDYENSLKIITDKYPNAEREGWALKEIQAKKWLSASVEQKKELKKELKILVNESENDTIEKIDELANEILTKSAIYQTIYGKETKRKKARLKALETAENFEDIKII